MPGVKPGAPPRKRDEDDEQDDNRKLGRAAVHRECRLLGFPYGCGNESSVQAIGESEVAAVTDAAGDARQQGEIGLYLRSNGSGATGIAGRDMNENENNREWWTADERKPLRRGGRGRA